MLSKGAYIVSCAILLFVAFIFHPRWNKTEGHATISWDVTGYYWYLPATIIYEDLKKQEFGDDIIDKYRPTPGFKQSFVHSSGNRVNVYTCGMAVVYLPFFTIAHIVAKPLGYAQDGFSIPYQLSLQLGCVLIAIIGLWYYRKLLLRYFSDKTAAIMLLLLVIGTNYLNYATVEAAQTHNVLFTLYVLLLLNTSNFYANPNYKYSIRIGLLIGLIALIRPTELIAIFIPLLWGLERISIKSFKERLSYLIAQRSKILLVACLIVAIGSLQIIYWLYVSGQPFVYSYEEKGFSWLAPHFYNYSLSYRSGWLTYTPLLIFSFVGLYSFVKHGENRVMVLVFFAFSFYITSAWDIWWYGGTGGRAMIQSYPVILMPLATFVEQLKDTKIRKWIFAPVILVFVYVNVWFTYAAHANGGLYDPNGMTKEYYWHVVGRFNVPPHTLLFKDTDEYFSGVPRGLTELYRNDFEEAIYDSVHVIDGQHSLCMDGNKEYGPSFTIPFEKNEADWLRASVWVQPIEQEWENWRMVQFIVSFTNKSNDPFVKSRMIRLNRYVYQAEGAKELHFDVKIPKENIDSVKVWFWNPGSQAPIVIDNLLLSSFKE